jgi:hypothetical protein
MHTLEERGDDAYIDPPIATTALLHIEPPQVLHDPACGQGIIVHTLRKAGHAVTASDIVDRGCSCMRIRNFPTEPFNLSETGIVTNPPFKDCEAFLRKALADGAPYVAMITRLNFLEGVKRRPLFEEFPPTRVHISLPPPGQRATVTNAAEKEPRLGVTICHGV